MCGGGSVGSIVGSVVGGAIGSVVPGVGTAMGAAIGGGLGGSGGAAIDGQGIGGVLTSGALGAVGGYYGGQLVGGMSTGATVAATAENAAEMGAQGAMGASEIAGGSLAGNMTVNTANFGVSQVASASEFANLAQAYTSLGLEVPTDIAAQAGLLNPGLTSEIMGAGWSLSPIASDAGYMSSMDVMNNILANGAGEFGSLSPGQLSQLYEASYAAGPSLGPYGYSTGSGYGTMLQSGYVGVPEGAEFTAQAGSQAGIDSAVAKINADTNMVGKVSNVLTGAFSENTPGVTYESYIDSLYSGQDMGKLAEGVKSGVLATGPEGQMVPNDIGIGVNLGKTGYSMATMPEFKDYDQSLQFQTAGQGYPSGMSLARARQQYPSSRQVQGYSVPKMVGAASQKYLYR